jgi:hypothetical protein
MIYLQGKCSYRRPEEVEDIKCVSSACYQYPPYQVRAVPAAPPLVTAAAEGRTTLDLTEIADCERVEIDTLPRV